MPRRKFNIPISIILFLAFVLVGTYFVRKRILERHMLSALETGDEKTIRSLLSTWPCPSRAATQDGTTALHWAVAVGEAEVVEFLLAKGVDVNAVGSWELTRVSGIPRGTQGTALQFALFEGHDGIAQMLITRGADVNTDAGFMSPLEWAIATSDKDLMKRLFRAGAEIRGNAWRFFCFFSPSWSTDIAQILLDHGADIDAWDDAGKTLLHFVSDAGARAFTAFLLEKGADATVKDKDGKTPLMLAEENGHKDVAELLRKHGAAAPRNEE